MVRCHGLLAASARTRPPTDEAIRAAAASRRLDDAFRSYLAQRGTKPASLAEMTSLVNGVVGLRVAADAVLDLWERDDGCAGGDRAAARAEVLATTSLVVSWYQALAASLAGGSKAPEPLARDELADSRLVEALRQDLLGSDTRAGATAARMIWTGDYLDALRRLQVMVAGPRGPSTSPLPGR